VVLADTVMPGRTGYEICQYLKMNPRHRHVRVILTAGVLEAFDEERARHVEADGALKKPFEASALLSVVKPLAEAAARDRSAAAPHATAAQPEAAAEAPFVAVVDAEHVRAAVTVALDASLDLMVAEITRRVLEVLRLGNETRAAEESAGPVLAPPHSEPPAPVLPAEPAPRIEPVRRVTPLRMRSGSILGLDISRPDPPPPDAE
jgi:CheY-like chemotaxis protein